MSGIYNRFVKGFLRPADVARVALTGAYADLGGKPQPGLHVPIYTNAGAFASWASMPATESIFLGAARWNQVARADLSGYTQCRLCLVVGTAGFSTAKIIAKYAAAFSTSLGPYANLGVAEVSVGLATGNSYAASAWVDLAPGAKADVHLILTGSGGNGSVSPTLGNISLQFR